MWGCTRVACRETPLAAGPGGLQGVQSRLIEGAVMLLHKLRYDAAAHTHLLAS